MQHIAANLAVHRYGALRQEFRGAAVEPGTVEGMARIKVKLAVDTVAVDRASIRRNPRATKDHWRCDPNQGWCSRISTIGSCPVLQIGEGRNVSRIVGD